MVTFVEPLLRQMGTEEIADQLLRASDSVVSNYRAAGRGKSHDDFTNKIAIVLEEADEVEGCLGRLRGRNGVDEGRRLSLEDEASQLVRIFSASLRTAKRNQALRHRQGKRRRAQ